MESSMFCDFGSLMTMVLPNLLFQIKKPEEVLSLPLCHIGSESLIVIPLRIPQLFTLAFHYMRFLPWCLFANIF